VAYYVGDPCYIIRDELWDDFCTKLFANEEFNKGGHYDGSIQWENQTIEIWSNGGDGTWSFPIRDDYGDNSFCVDSGTFCVIDIDKLENIDDSGLRLGMRFNKEPTLCVEDGIVFINDTPDNTVQECDNCGELVYENDIIWSKGGDMYCWYCYDESVEEEE